MKTAIVLLSSVLALTAAAGTYHQEYNYKSSSSSYKNNELQHRDDSSGFYSKDGDIEGRFKPKVNSHNEHSEYVNPKLHTQTHTGMNMDHNGAMSSYGQMNAQQMGSGYDSDIYGSGSYGSGSHGSNAYGSGSSGSAMYGSGSYGSMGSSSNYYTSGHTQSASLQSMTQRLQSQLERQLQDMLHTQRGTAYSTGALNDLEAALSRNLSQRWDDELMSTYGTQSIKSGQSYSILGGRVQPTANYNIQELSDLKRQMEANLLQKLRSEYRQYQSSNSHNSNYNDYEYSHTTTYRPYSTLYPNLQSTTYRPFIYAGTTTMRTSFNSYNQHQESSSQIRYTPIPNPASITLIASSVQSDLDRRLNMLLENIQQRYFSQNAYGVTNYDVVLSRLQDELRANVTSLLDDEIRRNYGQQTASNGYMYSTGSSGQLSQQHNYSIRDFENLRAQIEKNLLQKLNSDFQSKRTRFEQSNSYSSSNYGSSSSYGSQYGSNQYNSGMDTYSVRPVINTGIKTHGNNYQYSSGGSSHAGYEVASGGLSQLQRQLQENLSRQLQSAITKTAHSSGYSSGYSSGSMNPQSFQVSLQELQDQLNRNLTRQLEEVRSGYGSYSSYGGSAVSESQLANLRDQLATDLQRQLQQGLRQSWSSSSSYSASASSSNFRPVRGLESLSQQMGANLVEGHNCNDNLHHHGLRLRRHIGAYGGYHSRDSSYSHGGFGYSSHRGYGVDHHHNHHHNNQYSGQQQQQEEVDAGQVIEDDAFAKLQVEQQSGSLSGYGYHGHHGHSYHQQPHSHSKLGQQQVEFGQQTEDDFGALEVGNQHVGQQAGPNRYGHHASVGHHTNNKYVGYGQQQIGQEQVDLGQQIEDDDFAKLQVGSQLYRNKFTGQTGHLGQQIQENSFGKFQVGQQTGQKQVDLGQQIEEENFGKLQIGQQTEHVDMGQQIEEDNFGKLEVGNQQTSSKYTGQQQLELGQELEDDSVGKLQIGQQQADLGQQIEEDNFGQLQVGNQQTINKHTGQQQVELGQELEDDSFGKLEIGQQQADLGQQIEEDNFGKLQVGNQQTSNKHTGQQQVDLGQELEDDSFGKLEVGQQQADLGQQIEEDNFGKLQVSSQQTSNVHTGQQQVDLGQELEDDSFGNLQVGQQIEEDNFSKLHVGQQQQSNNRLIGQSQTQENKFYNQVAYGDLNQQVEDSALGKTQTNAQRQRGIDGEFLTSIGHQGGVRPTNQISSTSTSTSTTTSTQSSVVVNTGNTISNTATNGMTDEEKLRQSQREADDLIERIRASARRNQKAQTQTQTQQKPFRGYNYGYSSGSGSSSYGSSNYGSSSYGSSNYGSSSYGSSNYGSSSYGSSNYGSSSYGSSNYGSSSYGSSNHGSSNYGSRQTTGGTNYLTSSHSYQQPEPQRIYESHVDFNLQKPQQPHGYRSSGGYNSGLNFGTQNQLSHTTETLEDFEMSYTGIPQKATVVEPISGGSPSKTTNVEQISDFQVEPIKPVEATNVKSSSAQPEREVEIVSSTEKPGWWSSFKQKVSSTATNIKNKLTGKTEQ